MRIKLKRLNRAEREWCPFGRFKSSKWLWPVTVETKLKEKDSILLGTLNFKLDRHFDKDILQKASKLKLYFRTGNSFIYTKWRKGQRKTTTLFNIVEGSEYSFLAARNSCELLQFVLNLTADPFTIKLEVRYSRSAVLSTDNTIQVFPLVQKLVEHFYGIKIPQVNSATDFLSRDNAGHIDLLYSIVKDYHNSKKNSAPQVDVQHPQLNVVLRPYQYNAANWMLHQENQLHHPATDLHPLYTEFTTLTGEKLFYNKYLGSFAKEKPIVETSTPGGILADEMGLGKTVEVLACILANPRQVFINEDNVNGNQDMEIIEENESATPRKKLRFSNCSTVQMVECICGKVEEASIHKRHQVRCVGCEIFQHPKCVGFDPGMMGPYYCPHCSASQPKIPCKATMIVAPSAVSSQWIKELKKLVEKNCLRVKFYKGLFKEKYNQPKSFEEYDIVITSYEILSKELSYVDLPDERILRSAKRYNTVPSPLLCVQWWRVCLDEAQMVESTTAKSAQMALRLSALHRWCITSTPVQRTLDDLRGLALFLGVDMGERWNVLIQEPYNAGNPIPMCEMMCPLMWRTAKADVQDQINIPPQTETIHWVNFSPIEKQFYSQLHSRCLKKLLEVFFSHPNLDVGLKTLPGDELNRILIPLTQLRQYCCYPPDSPHFEVDDEDTRCSLQKLLTNLVQKGKTEHETTLHKIFSSLNGLAGLKMIQEKWVDAAQYYREALSVMVKKGVKNGANKLQKLHALHNLKELLESNRIGVECTVSDANLEKDANKLEEEIFTDISDPVKNAKLALLPLTEKVNKLHTQMLLKETAWWRSVLALANNIDSGKKLLEMVKLEIDDLGEKNEISTYTSLDSIEAILHKYTRDVHKLRNLFLNDLLSFQTTKSRLLAVDCHLRREVKEDKQGLRIEKINKCMLCNLKGKLKEYRKIFFSTGTLKIFQALHSYALLSACVDLAKDGQTHLTEIEAMRQEYECLSDLWERMDDYISSADQLKMCKLRFQMSKENEPPIKTKIIERTCRPNFGFNPKRLIIYPRSVEKKCRSLTSLIHEGESSLKRLDGQLEYLKKLERDCIASTGEQNIKSCKLCSISMRLEWTVLPCGHCYCSDCLGVMERRAPTKTHLTCIKCRGKVEITEISKVNNKIKQDQINFGVDCFKSDNEKLDEHKSSKYSSKVGAIVLEILKIVKSNPSDKIIIFSTWTYMLGILQKALPENGISCVKAGSPAKNFDEAIQFFKDPLKEITVLLLKVCKGSAGLNLTEARHAFLVEPILNPASELQAVGRVHRFGQDKATVVHRFLVKDTIEERMQTVLKANQDCPNQDEDPLTLKNLYEMMTSQ